MITTSPRETSIAPLQTPSQNMGTAPGPTRWKRPPEERLNRRSSIPFFIAHALPLLALFTGLPRGAVAMALILFFARMFFITAGYHRYFSHRSYKMSRIATATMAFLGTTAAQKGPLWWAQHHRDHHKYADTERDPHSPLGGFWWSHMGWFLSDKYKDTDFGAIDDFARYPEIRFIDRHNWIGPWALGVASYLVGGWSGLVVGFFLSTVVLWHTTFLVNSVSHVWGRRRFETDDTSRNSLLVALLTGGEGWHNNHHHYAPSARQGFYWWEIDTTWYMLRLMSFLGIVRDLRQPSAKVLAQRRVSARSPG